MGGVGSHGEPAPLLCHIRDGEDSSFATVRRLLSISVVEQDALEAPAHGSEGQTQFYHFLLGICDGEEDSSSLSGWTHLWQQC